MATLPCHRLLSALPVGSRFTPIEGAEDHGIVHEIIEQDGDRALVRALIDLELNPTMTIPSDEFVIVIEQ